jgi:hypothetical protein
LLHHDEHKEKLYCLIWLDWARVYILTKVVNYYTAEGAGAGRLEEALTPSLKPFLNRRGRCLKYRIRPVPVVRLLFDFSDQLNFLFLADGYPQEAQRFFCRWYALRPQRIHKT